MASLKAARTTAKRAATRAINRVSQSLAECSPELSGHIDTLKQVFKDFTLAHSVYHDTLTDDAEIDESDSYFFQVQRAYIAVLKEANKFHATVKTEPDSHVAETDLTRRELLGLTNMANVELEVYDGNPLSYHQFISSFDANVDKMCDDPDLKLSRLLKFTSGEAKEALQGCLLIGGVDGYSEARSILSELFGDPHLVTERLLSNLRSGKPARTPSDIRKLAVDLKNAMLVLKDLDCLREVDSQYFMLEVASRLPNFVQSRWRTLAYQTRKSTKSYPDFKVFVDFVVNVAGEVNDPVYGSAPAKRSDKPKYTVKPLSSHAASASVTGTPHASHAASASVTSSPLAQPSVQGACAPNSASKPQAYAKPEPPCVLCGQCHRLWHCEQFRRMQPPGRLQVVVNYKLCHNCLLSSHQTENCGKRSVCSVQGCGKKHTKFIHCDTPPGNVTVSNASFFAARGSHMPIVQVIVNKTCCVFALLDSGSTNSFCSRDLAHYLGLKGAAQEFNLNTLNSSCKRTLPVIDLSISSGDGAALNMTDVCVVDTIPVSTQPVDVGSYAHFSEIGPLPAYEIDKVSVDLLIGQDNAEALLPLEVKRGKPGEPFAVRTLFGWAVYGQAPLSKTSRQVVCHFVCNSTPLEDAVTRLWQVENEGLDTMSWSRDDKAVIDIFDKECKFIDGRYEIPIPWKDGAEPLPNNFVVAKRRLDSLFKRFDKDGLYDRYKAEIVKLLDKNYAEIVPDHEIFTVDRTWYLPHHAVVTDKKPDKLRVVFDCSSQYQGRSLNERCLQGPDLINKLLPVLLRFRQHSLAIQADIEAMYNQVRIPAQDRDALRFLWYAHDKLEYYRMTTHLFGARWCACSSTYALLRTVNDPANINPLVKRTVERCFYVDDCLCSVATRVEAEAVIR
jgi:hypothetical protein